MEINNIVFLPGHGAVKKNEVSNLLVDSLALSVEHFQKDLFRRSSLILGEVAFYFDYLEKLLYTLDANGVGIKKEAKKMAALLKARTNYQGTPTELWKEISKKHAESLQKWRLQGLLKIS